MKQHHREHRSVIGLALGALAMLAFAPTAVSDQVSLGPSKDNTLFGTGNTSNGAGPQFFSGRTGEFRGFIRQRAVLEFDVGAVVPAGATITSVTLTLHLERANDDTERLHSLHRVLAEWGEGASAAGGGSGGLVTDGDVTWMHTFYPDQFWANEGGDFDPAVSGEQFVPIEDFDPVPVTWGSTDGMVADVQLWLDHPEDNHGWLVMGDEVDTQTSRKFSSREHEVVEQRPVLTIDYVMGTTCPADLDGDGAVTVLDLLILVHDFNLEGDLPSDLDGDGRVTSADLLMLLAAMGPCPGVTICPADVNGDGAVNILDLLSVVHSFGVEGDVAEDINGDGVVAVGDLLMVIQNFGPCPE